MIIAVSVCATAFMASSPVHGAGTDAYIVKDINPGAACTRFGVTVPCGGVSDQMNSATMGNSLFFTANDGTNGRELWKSDGTAAGTAMVKNINPGTSCDENGVTGGCSGRVNALTVVGNILFFAADDGSHGLELWKSDGTPEGTVMVKDIYTGSCSFPVTEFCNSNPGQFKAAANVLYFAANDGVHGMELWKSDGTSVGTVMVKDIDPGTGCTKYGASADSGCWGMDSRFGEYMNVVGGTLYFSADDGAHGMELWKSDGTSVGTVMVKDINMETIWDGSTDGGYNGPAVVLGGILYFKADDGVHGVELWKSDGTSVGTVMVKDINPGTCETGGRAYPCYGASSTPFVVAGMMLLAADDGVHGVELWKSDGTSVGTVMVKDINTGAACTRFGVTGPCSGYSSMNTGFAKVAGNTLYFAADDGTNGEELWKSDGTSEGTVMVRDINTGAACTRYGQTITCSGLVIGPVGTAVGESSFYFTADDGSHGSELWKSDGTPVGTVMVKDINTGAACTSFGVTGPCGGINGMSDIKTVAGRTVFFVANDGASGEELWAYDSGSSGVSPSSTSPSTVPGSTSPATTVPAIVVTPTTVPATKTSTIPTITKGSVTNSSIAQIAAIAVPAGAKVGLKIAASSVKNCKVSGGKIVKIKSGDCVVSVTVTPKKGKSKTATAKLKFK